MNESLLRDLHDTQIEELTTLKTAIKELAEKPTASPADIEKIRLMLSNIKLPAQDFSELEQYIYNTVMSITSNTDTQVTKIDKLVRSCNNNLVDIYDSIDNKLDDLVQRQNNQKPKVTIHKLDSSSWKMLFTTLSLLVISIGLSIYAYNLNVKNIRFRTNDIKYRYVKMVSDVDDSLVYDLEELIYNDKSGKVLKKMEQQVDDYERAIELKIRAEEQAKLNQAESAKLDKQIKELQGK